MDQPFKQWGIDFIGELILNSFNGHKYVLIVIDYYTRWQKCLTKHGIPT